MTLADCSCGTHAACQILRLRGQNMYCLFPNMNLTRHGDFAAPLRRHATSFQLALL